MFERHINFSDTVQTSSRRSLIWRAVREIISGHLFFAVGKTVDSLGSGEWKSLSMYIKYWLYETRSSTCFNDTACRVYNISYDGGSKYLRTMFVGSGVREYARVRARVCRLRRNYPTMTLKEKNIKFCRSGGITAPAIKYRRLCPLGKFARGWNARFARRR